MDNHDRLIMAEANIRALAEYAANGKAGITLLKGSALDILFILDELNRERAYRFAVMAREKRECPDSM